MENTTDIRLITLTSFVRPKVIENISKNWVLNGKRNFFYHYIIDRFNGSPTNAAIINSYADWIYGGGLAATNSLTNVEDWLKLKSILKPQDVKKIISDFYLFGEASMQTIRTKGKNLSSIKHIPKQKIIPSLVNEDNEIENYFFSNDWEKTNPRQNKEPEKFSAFGTSKDAIEIFVIKPYKAGKDYFADPTYLSTLPYAEMEEEIANLNINAIKNGLSAGYVINVPDGINLSAEQKEQFELKIKRRLTGSPNASSFVLSFNGRDAEIKITPFPVNEKIHLQWQFLVTEAKNQLITGHRVISPILFGIDKAAGFGNNADELVTAREEQMLLTIKPLQTFILDAFTEILEFYGINLDLFFKPLKEVIETPTQLSTHVTGASEEMANTLIQFGEVMSEEWILLSTADVDYDTDDDLYDLIQLTNTGIARPNARSEQDSKDIAIRYRYVGSPVPERLFCKLMMIANKLYRKEDILQMGNKGSNDGFGKGGSDSYSIWLWKGGGRLSTAFPNGTCKHKWQREIYLKRGGGVDVNSPLARTITTTEARRKGFKVPVNPSDVSITPNKNKS